MKNNRKAGVVVGIIAAAAVALAPAAFATNTVEVAGLTTPVANVPFTGINKESVTLHTDWGVPVACTGVTISGYVIRGGLALAGNKVGAVTNAMFSSCALTSLNYPVHVTKKPFPTEWGIFVRVTPTAKAQNLIQVEIRDVYLYAKSTGVAPHLCEVQARGTIPAVFKRDTQQLIISTGAAFPLTLTAYDGSGIKGLGNVLPAGSGTCAGQIETGDRAGVTARFAVATSGVGGIQLR